MAAPEIAIGVAVTGIVIGAAPRLRTRAEEIGRAEFIRPESRPPGLSERVRTRHPEPGRKEMALSGDGLRRFFLTHPKSGRRYVAMPSEAADQLWREFNLHTRDCDT